MLTRTGAKEMDLQVPVIVLLLIANVLWFIVGWAMGYKESQDDHKFILQASENAR
jgi:hypothetical protein